MDVSSISRAVAMEKLSMVGEAVLIELLKSSEFSFYGCAAIRIVEDSLDVTNESRGFGRPRSETMEGEEGDDGFVGQSCDESVYQGLYKRGLRMPRVPFPFFPLYGTTCLHICT